MTPLVQFHDAKNVMGLFNGDSWVDEHQITNEWIMVAVRGAVENNGTQVRFLQEAWDWDDAEPRDTQDKTCDLWLQRTDGCFAKHSRIAYQMSSMTGFKTADGTCWRRRNVWGAKLYREWLDEGMIESIRDKDRDEMIRRAIPQHWQF